MAEGYIAAVRLDRPDPLSVHHYVTVEAVIIAAV
jgi:hypothetical protein